MFTTIPIIFLLFLSYLSKGLVEKLEVVNKKWVRVRLMPGTTVGSVCFFNYKTAVKVYFCIIFGFVYYY